MSNVLPGYTLPTGVDKTAASVKAKQTELKNAGYSPGTVDGVWGPKTQAAYDKYTADQEYKNALAAARPDTNYGGTAQSIYSGAPGYDANAYTQYFKDAMAQAQEAQNMSTAATLAQYEALRPSLYNAYANANTTTQNTARLSAIGNNEYLAAKGMAGNLYAGPQSGMSETSRIAGDVSMQNSMNANQQSYTDKIAELETTIATAKSSGNQRLAEIASEYLVQIANAKMQADQQANANYFNAVGLAQSQIGQKNSDSATYAALLGNSKGSTGSTSNGSKNTGGYQPPMVDPTIYNKLLKEYLDVLNAQGATSGMIVGTNGKKK